jgi:hypothetical protein
MAFSEPTTMLTDYGLTGLCGLLSWRLWRVWRAMSQISVGCWAAGLACLGVASLAGGTVHGFSEILSQAALQRLWMVTIFAIGVASFCLLVGTLTACCPFPIRRWLILIPVIQLIGYVLWMLTHRDFRSVIYDYTFTLLSVLALQLHAALTRMEKSAFWLIGGVVVSAAASAIQASGISLHRHFNHNDFYHVIQMGGIYLFYRGALQLKDR